VKLTSLECRRCEASTKRPSKAFVLEHIDHGRLHGSITVKNASGGSDTSTAHLTRNDVHGRDLSPAEKLKAGLFGDVLQTFRALMEEP